MNLYGFPEGQILAFALIFLRIIAFVIAWPVFGSANVPVPVKILLAVVFTLAVYPAVPLTHAQNLSADNNLILLAGRELLVGLILGFLMRAFFFAINVAGQLISITMSLASAQLYNPAFDSQTNVVEQLQLALATLFFLAINGHHLFLVGLVQSFDLLPISVLAINTAAFTGVVQIGQQVLTIGLQMAAPVMVALFLANIAMGILGRAVPQINVLITSLPVTILAGIGVLFVTIPMFVNEMSMLLDVMAGEFFKVLRVL